MRYDGYSILTSYETHEKDMSRRKRFLRASRETNRYFHPDIPLHAPHDKGELPARSTLFDQTHQDMQWFGEKIARHVYEDIEYSVLRGKRTFAYPIMALLVRKDYGDIDAALAEQVLSEEESIHEPFVTKDDEGNFHCPLQQALHNPLARGGLEQKTYDPSKANLWTQLRNSVGPAPEYCGSSTRIP